MQDSIICSGFTPAKAPVVVELVQRFFTFITFHKFDTTIGKLYMSNNETGVW